MPYPLLIVSQLFILAWLTTTAWRVSQETVKPNRRSGRRLLSIAGVYTLTMLTRLILGATMLRDERWFASPVPTVFHLGLAGLFVRVRPSACAPWLNCCHRFTIRRPWLGRSRLRRPAGGRYAPDRQYLRSGIVSRGRRYLARAAATKSRHVATVHARGQNRSDVHGRRAAGVSAADGIPVHVRAHRARTVTEPADRPNLASRLADLDAGGADGAGRRLLALLAAPRCS